MDPTLEESIKQYHPHKQNILLKQSTIYQPFFFNRHNMPFDPTQANRQYHEQRCGSVKKACKLKKTQK